MKDNGLSKEEKQIAQEFRDSKADDNSPMAQSMKLMFPTLEGLYAKYKEYLHIEDTNRIDVVLATALSSKMEGIPLWLILVGPSGDMKSVQLNAIQEWSHSFVLHNLTSKTLVNGYKNKEEHPDLAPSLDKKVIIIPDMAQILKLPAVEKGELWGQLRDLYDGYAGKMSGQGSSATYKDLKVTLIGASTPAIDAQILVHQDLGTRELLYRTNGNIDKDEVMMRCFENEEREKQIKDEIKKITIDFLNSTKIREIKLDIQDLFEIMRIAKFVAKMRASGEFDNYTNELRNWVYPEEPTRIAKQLKRMYKCLMSLDKKYDKYKAFEILWHIAKSCAFPLRVKIYNFLEQAENEYSTSQISHILHLGKSTVKRECAIMENMGILNCRRTETPYPDKFYEHWSFVKPKNGGHND